MPNIASSAPIRSAGAGPDSPTRLLVIVPAQTDEHASQAVQDGWRARLHGFADAPELIFAEAEREDWRPVRDLDFAAVLLDWSAPGSDDAAPMVRAREVAGFAPILAVTPGREHARSQLAERLGAKEAVGRDQLDASPLGARLRHLIESDRMLSELRANRERARRSATRDALTGLIDRASLLEMLDRTLAANERKHASSALLLFDLDDFGAIDRRIGRPASDELLRRVAERLLQLTRRGDIAGRVGGDEFAVVLASPRDVTAPARAVERILDAFAEPLRIHGCEFRIEASTGIALAPEDGARADELMRSAEHALLDAKQAARGGHRHADPVLGDDVGRLIADERSLRRAIAAEPAPLRFEPQIDVLGGQVRALRSTLDWNARHGPSEDWRARVARGRSAEIEQLVFGWHVRGALEFAARWAANSASAPGDAQARSPRAATLPGDVSGTALALDVARRPLCGRQLDAFAQAAEALRSAPARPGWAAVGFEVEFALEAEPSSDEAVALAAIRRLAALGIGLALRVDGLSAATLGRIRDLPLSALVVDRSRVAKAHSDPFERHLLEAVARVGRERGLRIVADGVDAPAQRDLLLELGCREMRGSLFAKALTGDEAEELLRASQRGEATPWDAALGDA